MRMSPSSSSTISTSITLELVTSTIAVLVLGIVGVLGWLYCQGRWGFLVAGRTRGVQGKGLRGHRQRKAEPRAVGIGGVQPDLAAEVIDDLPAHGQADAGALVGGPVVQPLEDHEDALGVLRVDAHAVVGEREQPELPVAAGGDDDAGRLAAAGI